MEVFICFSTKFKKELKKEKINERTTKCQGQRNLHIHEIRTSLYVRDGRWEKKWKKVCCD